MNIKIENGEVVKNADYIIIDEMEWQPTTRDTNACTYQFKNSDISKYIEESTEIFTIREFVSEVVWNSRKPISKEKSNALEYVVRTQYTPKAVYAYCWEMTSFIEAKIKQWDERLVPVFIYERATRTHYKYESAWDKLVSINTMPNEEKTSREYVEKWRRCFGIDLSAPAIELLQPDNNITHFGHTHVERSAVDNKHSRKYAPTPLTYHFSQDKLASKEEIINAENQIKWYFKMIDEKQLTEAEACTEDYCICRRCHNNPAISNPFRHDYLERLCENCSDETSKKKESKIIITEIGFSVL